MVDQKKCACALRALARAEDPEPQHAFQVCRNARRIFDATQPIHGMGAPEWRLLKAAALLHDIGHRRGFKRHHKHSRDMILALDLPGMDARERGMVACVARYHRKTHPQPGHRVYSEFPSADQHLICKLAALLRIADGLDRAHLASVRAIHAQIDPAEVRLLVTQDKSSDLDIWGAARKAALFEEVYQRRIAVLRSEAI